LTLEHLCVQGFVLFLDDITEILTEVN